jgi:hypothetical protein
VKGRQGNICPCSYRLIREADFSSRFGRCEVEHDHRLFPAAFADLLLSDEMCDYVQDLRRIGVSPLKIQLALQARGVHLSCGQIHNLCGPGCFAAFTDSSAELISWVVDYGGACYSYDERIHDDVARVAVFTQMPDKRQVVHEFGDVLEIDGTHAPLKTNWEIVPITLICSRTAALEGLGRFSSFGVIGWGCCWVSSMNGEGETRRAWDDAGSSELAIVSFKIVRRAIDAGH